MLDSKHKKYIDDLCDILVAKFPVPQDQVDQITIALTYKFMCDMDKESVALGGKVSFFKGDWSKYSWESLFDSKTTGDERKAIYKHVVENLGHNPNLRPLFRDIFSNPPNPFNDVKKLFEFLKIIDKFSYENSETLGNAYEYLLSKTGAQGKLGQFRTPRHIIDFIVEIVNPKSNEKILDPACGTAGFLVSAFKHIRKNEKNLSAEKLLKLSENLVGYDIEPKMIRISLLNLFLQGFQTPKILESDLLSDDLFWNDYFDVMLANPPFFTPKGGISAHRGFNLESKRAEVHFLDFIQSHIRPNGRAGVIVPEGVLFKDENAYKTLRKNIIQNSLIGVVSLPAGVFKPYAGVKTAILFLDKKVAKQTDSIFFGIVNNDGYALNDNRDPIDKNDLPKVRDSIIKGNVNDNFFYISKEEVLNEKRFLLTANSYKKIKKIDSEYPIVPVTDVYKVVTPSAKIKKRDFLTKGKYPIIDQSQDDIAGYWNKDQDKMNFNNPVIIFGDHTRSLKYIDFEFVVGADGVKILEPKENILPKFLFYMLKTLKIRNLGYSRHYKELKDKKIPLPTLEVQQEIVDELEGYQKIIDGCKQVVENYKPTIDIDPSWEMVELGKMAKTQYGTSNKSLDIGKIPVLRMGNLQNGEIEYDDLVFSDNEEDIKKYSLDEGDILFNRSNSPKLVGKTSIFRGYKSAIIFAGYLVRVKASQEKILPEYLNVILNSTYSEMLNTKNVFISGNQANINASKLAAYPIPLPSLHIQKEIVQKIEEERKVIEGNKKLIEIYTQKIQDRINKVWSED